MPSVADERVPLTSAPASACCTSGRVEKSRPIAIDVSESATLRPRASDDHDASARVRVVPVGERLEGACSAAPAPASARSSGSCDRMASENASCCRSLVSRRSTELAYDTPERDLEHEQDEDGDREVAEEQAPLHGAAVTR